MDKNKLRDAIEAKLKEDGVTPDNAMLDKITKEIWRQLSKRMTKTITADLDGFVEDVNKPEDPVKPTPSGVEIGP